MKNKSQRVKILRLKDKEQFVLDLQNLILAKSNAGLISLGLHYACRKFATSLEDIALSEELQFVKKQ